MKLQIERIKPVIDMPFPMLLSLRLLAIPIAEKIVPNIAKLYIAIIIEAVSELLESVMEKEAIDITAARMPNTSPAFAIPFLVLTI